jgi:restriction system protein
MIPDFQTLMRPVLAHLADGQPRPIKGVGTAMADEFQLTDEERAARQPSGKQRFIDNRVQWATSHMFQAGLVTRPVRGHVQLTELGRTVLAQNPDRVDMRVLAQFPPYLAFRQRTSARKSETLPQAPSVPEDLVQQPASPQDLVASAVAENRAAVEGDVLIRALALDPTDFERLVLRLLESMGYGRAGLVEHSGKSGDAGIDGIISRDPLGLDRIYLQAKRYAPDQTVSRPAIQSFVGALMGAQGDRGVFLTTSSFTTGARVEADRVSARIELIDGARLSELLVRHGVGVQVQTTAALYEVDEDFFETL